MELCERDRIRMTPLAIRQGLHRPGNRPVNPSDKGILISVLRDGSLRVLRDDRKEITRYHADFWERET